MAAVMEATRDDFREMVAQGLVLVDVWGQSCQRCLALMPHVEELAAVRDELRVVTLEVPADVYEDQVGVMADVLDAGELSAAVAGMRDRAPEAP